jgi:hypothetical protein
MKPHRFLVFALVPLLAIGGYIVAGLISSGSTPNAPQAYRLKVQGSCNLDKSGLCILQHGTLVIRLSRMAAQEQEQGVKLKLEATESLKGAAISIGNERAPANMSAGENKQLWFVTLNRDEGQGILRLLLSTRDASYFAECPVTL